MSDKLNRLADQLEQVRVYQYEDGCNDPEDAKGRDEAVRLLRTLAPVLAKCEGAMKSILDGFTTKSGDYAPIECDGDGKSYPPREDWESLRSALAALREVRR